MSTFGLNLRYALRSLRRNLRLTVVAALTLTLGIGASTAILSVTKGVLLDPLPYPEPERLALIWSEMPATGYTRAPISGVELDDLRRRSQTFEAFASIWSTTASLVQDNEPETLRVALTTWNFLALLGAKPALGRGFADTDEGDGVETSVILSDALWQRRFGGEPAVIGRRIRLDGGWGFPGGTYTVVGVLPADFRLILPNDAGVATGIDAWTPFARNLAAQPRGMYYLRTIGRLGPGASLEAGQEEVRAIGDELAASYPEYAATGRAFNAVSLKGDAVGPVRPVIFALLVGVGFLLLISCANVASLLLARAAGREQEILLRTALGANARQIGAHLLTESLLLATVGGVGGLVVGSWALQGLLTLAPDNLPRAATVALDPWTLVVALGSSLACGIGFGLAPILATRKLQLHSGLRGDGVSTATGHRGRDALVVAELALAFVLSVGAVLCLRTVERLEQVDLGFDPVGVLSMELNLPGQRYGTQDQLTQFTRELERRLLVVAGVEAAGAINQLPLSDLPNWSSPYSLRTSPAGEAHEADARVVTPGYFAAVNARLLEGRLIEPADDGDSRPVVVIDDLLAAKAWPEKSAIGQELLIEVRQEGGFLPVWAEVVGVVRHMRHHDPRFEVREQLYVPFAQGARNQMGVVVRASVDPRLAIDGVRAQVAALDPELAVSLVRPLDDYARDARGVQRFTMVLAATFAVMALVLGCIGLYGVMTYAVNSRRHEIGLRLALGSTSGAITRRVLGRGLILVASGIGLGLAGALATGWLLEGLLFGVSPSDPATLAAIPLLLGLVALVAGWLPAHRASRIDPATVLHEE